MAILAQRTLAYRHHCDQITVCPAQWLETRVEIRGMPIERNLIPKIAFDGLFPTLRSESPHIQNE